MSEVHREIEPRVSRRVDRRRIVPRTAASRVAGTVLIGVVVSRRVVRVEEVLAVHANVQTGLPEAEDLGNAEVNLSAAIVRVQLVVVVEEGDVGVASRGSARWYAPKDLLDDAVGHRPGCGPRDGRL